MKPTETVRYPVEVDLPVSGNTSLDIIKTEVLKGFERELQQLEQQFNDL